MRREIQAPASRHQGRRYRHWMRPTGLLCLPLLAAAAIVLTTQHASAQFRSDGPRFNVSPNMGPFRPRIEPRIFRGHPFGPRIYSDRPVEIVPRDHDDIDDDYVDEPERGPKHHRHSKKASRHKRHSNPSGQVGRAYIPPLNSRDVRPDEVIVEVDGNPNAAFANRLARRHRLVREESQFFTLTNSTVYRWRIPDRRSLRSVLVEVGNDPRVLSVQPNIVSRLQQSEPASLPRGDGADSVQYAVRKLHVVQAHDFARGDNVLVAVIDSGIDITHPELAGVIAGTFDALNSREGPHAHGTAVAGLIAAHGRLIGMAPAARILAARAFSAKGNSAESTTMAIIKSLEWAATHGARVINMSFAGPRDPSVERRLAAAHKKGIVLVAAAGNAGPKSPPLYPAADPEVIAVTATDSDDRLFPASNRGRYIAVAAPGVDMLVLSLKGHYAMGSGTSYAAPQVSGIAALLLQRQPHLRPNVVREILMASARDLGPKGRDAMFGAGLADALKAVRSLGKDTATNTPRPQRAKVER
jgi:Subtilase family